MKILIAYFSREWSNYVGESLKNLKEGNTEVAAKMIQKLSGGELFRIATVSGYPPDYEETTRVAQKEQRQNARPGLAGRVAGMEAYDLVILGYPNWWGTMPMAVFTFLEAYDLSGKTILPFCTHEGSGMGHSEGDIKKLCPRSTLLKGLAIRGSGVHGAEKELAAWLMAAKVIG